MGSRKHTYEEMEKSFKLIKALIKRNHGNFKISIIFLFFSNRYFDQDDDGYISLEVKLRQAIELFLNNKLKIFVLLFNKKKTGARTSFSKTWIKLY